MFPVFSFQGTGMGRCECIGRQVPQWCPGPPAPNPTVGCLQQPPLGLITWWPFWVRGESGSRGTNPGKFWHHTHPLPHQVQSLVVGVGSIQQSNAVQLSWVRVKVQSETWLGKWTDHNGDHGMSFSFRWVSTAPCSADCWVSSSS